MTAALIGLAILLAALGVYLGLRDISKAIRDGYEVNDDPYDYDEDGEEEDGETVVYRCAQFKEPFDGRGVGYEVTRVEETEEAVKELARE